MMFPSSSLSATALTFAYLSSSAFFSLTSSVMGMGNRVPSGSRIESTTDSYSA